MTDPTPSEESMEKAREWLSSNVDMVMSEWRYAEQSLARLLDSESAQAREAADLEARNWKADALLRAQNSDYWRGEAEELRAALEEIVEDANGGAINRGLDSIQNAERLLARTETPKD